MFERPNPGVFEAALRCENTEAKRPGPVKLLSRTRWVNKDLLVSGALAGFALITGYGTPSCCTFSSPLNPFILLYPQPQRCAILFLFIHSSVQHTSSAIVLLWSQACRQGSQLHYLALPRNALFVLRDSSHTSCKHDGKLSDCPPAFTFNSARNSQSRDGLLLGLTLYGLIERFLINQKLFKSMICYTFSV